jgi:GNAT superfamily N-acetyltransferase
LQLCEYWGVLPDSLVCRSGAIADVPDITRLFGDEIGSPPVVELLRQHVEEYPSIVAEADQMFAGFILTRTFAPDICEVANMLVAPRLRSRGVGAKMLGALESLLPVSVTALILGNSMLWPTASGEKRSAEPFYSRHGFAVAFRTSHSVVMAKTLRHR